MNIDSEDHDDGAIQVGDVWDYKAETNMASAPHMVISVGDEVVLVTWNGTDPVSFTRDYFLSSRNLVSRAGLPSH